MSAAVSFKVFCTRYGLDPKDPSSKAEYSTYKGNLKLFSKAASDTGVTSAPVKRVTVSLPPDVVEMLDDVSSVLGMSRSAFLSGLLRDSLPLLGATVKAAAEHVEGSPSRRYRDSSRDEIQELIKGLTSGAQNDLFK